MENSMNNERDAKFLSRAIELARQGMMSGKGGPFGCIIVKGDEIVGEGSNQVTSTNDPTAHAEIVAIRNACKHLNDYQLEGCELFTSCEPCPMCLGAIYWARPNRVVYANTKQQAADIDFDDNFIYGEINTAMEERKIPFIHHPHAEAEQVFEDWKNWEGKKLY